MDKKTYNGIVQKIFPQGSHGPYAKASSDIGTITFSLLPKVWKESRPPEEGEFVVLSEVTMKRAGWRAGSGRFYGPSDVTK